MSAIPPSGGAGALHQVMALRQQVMEQSEALRGLREAGGASGPAAALPASSAASPAPGGFADTLWSSLDAVNAAQARSSAMTAAYERGEVTDVAQVMLARQESSVAFEATLQVRNKLLTAYQEIMRMGV